MPRYKDLGTGDKQAVDSLIKTFKKGFSANRITAPSGLVTKLKSALANAVSNGDFSTGSLESQLLGLSLNNKNLQTGGSASMVYPNCVVTYNATYDGIQKAEGTASVVVEGLALSFIVGSAGGNSMLGTDLGGPFRTGDSIQVSGNARYALGGQGYVQICILHNRCYDAMGHWIKKGKFDSFCIVGVNRE